jgi:hypothetical protein
MNLLHIIVAEQAAEMEITNFLFRIHLEPKNSSNAIRASKSSGAVKIAVLVLL